MITPSRPFSSVTPFAVRFSIVLLLFILTLPFITRFLNEVVPSDFVVRFCEVPPVVPVRTTVPSFASNAPFDKLTSELKIVFPVIPKDAFREPDVPFTKSGEIVIGVEVSTRDALFVRVKLEPVV